MKVYIVVSEHRAEGQEVIAAYRVRPSDAVAKEVARDLSRYAQDEWDYWCEADVIELELHR